MPKDRTYEQRLQMLWFPQEYQGNFVDPSYVNEPTSYAAVLAGILSAGTIRVPEIPIQANPSFDLTAPRKPILPWHTESVCSVCFGLAEKILEAIVSSRR